MENGEVFKDVVEQNLKNATISTMSTMSNVLTFSKLT